MKTVRHAFTLIELLVVITIVALLAALIFPALAQSRAKARQAACASNLRQLGMAVLQYAQDADEQAPTAYSPATLFKGRFPLNMGWAGRVYPYVKNTQIFHCPADGTPEHSIDAATGQPAYGVSYGLNRNLSQTSSLIGASAPARTVLLFEVTRSAAQITDLNEGLPAGARMPLPTQLSAAGNGVDGTMLSWPKPITNPAADQFALYATGLIDNHTHDETNNDYQDDSGRHQGGTNFLALDGHVVWLPGQKVSAGFSAHNPSDSQTDTGCAWLGTGTGSLPCAEGVEANKHVLTFSLR